MIVIVTTSVVIVIVEMYQIVMIQEGVIVQEIMIIGQDYDLNIYQISDVVVMVNIVIMVKQ